MIEDNYLFYLTPIIVVITYILLNNTETEGILKTISDTSWVKNFIKSLILFTSALVSVMIVNKIEIEK